ncbi:MAG: etfA3 [Actinomycetia bacterium]|nr:etfA3 [Actinomycetes bacterium]
MTVYCLVELDAVSGGPAAGGSLAVADASLRALTVSRELATSASRPAPTVAAVVFADAASVPVADLATYGVTDIYAVPVDGYAPQAWARAIAGLLHSPARFSAVLAAGTDHGNEVLAHLGAITGLPMAANCVSASASASASAAADNAGLDLVRQRWAGLLLEEAVLDAPTALLTVATDAVPPVLAGQPVTVTIHEVKPSLEEADLVVRAAEAPAGAGGASLATARVVVGGGRGVGSADGFAALEELAELLGGVVGVSRVVTSEGWRPHTQQVGQTGTKITPDLYLACGISGAIQHIAGCSGAKHIIAVNTDPAAPMMSRADYAIVGDLHEVIPALIAALRAR